MTEPQQPHQPAWRPPSASAPRGPQPAAMLAGVLLLALVFVVGLVIGRSGLLDGPSTGAGPTGTPVAGSTTPPGSPGTPTTDPGTPTTDPGTPTPIGQSPAPGTPTTDPATPTPAGPRPTLPPDAPANFDLFWQAYEIVRQNFVGRGELDENAIVYGAIRGMVEALGDTGHSIFLTPEALQREQESLSGTIVGIGVLLGERDGAPVIVSVVSGGPASRAGLRSGDEIIEVDGEEVLDLAPDELAPLIRGDEGTTVEITVFRPSTEEALTFPIVREEISFPAADWTLVPGTDIGLLRLIQFSEGASEQLRTARDEAIAAGARGLILDLRSNPGGFVHEAVESASLFLDGEVVYIRQLASGERIPVETLPDIPSSDLPLVVLIDQGTASSAEILSGALLGAGRAELIGTTTFGTGTVLLTYELDDGSAVRIAVERWLTPEGQLIFGQGIEPTIELELEDDARPLEPDEVGALDPAALPTIEDAQLLRALELLGALP